MKSLAIFLFPGVQTLDLFGPVELLGGFEDRIAMTLVAETPAPVVTRHGQRIVPEKTIEDGTQYDMLLIPGGDRAISAGRRPAATKWIAATCETAELIMTVCTGSILLAMTGVLDGRQATTNKQDFRDTIPLGPSVDWVEEARWVRDGNIYTSSGVSAGMDMTLAVLAKLFGQREAEELADGIEYQWHKDPKWDPFAAKAGLGVS